MHKDKREDDVKGIMDLLKDIMWCCSSAEQGDAMAQGPSWMSSKRRTHTGSIVGVGGQTT